MADAVRSANSEYGRRLLISAFRGSIYSFSVGSSTAGLVMDHPPDDWEVSRRRAYKLIVVSGKSWPRLLKRDLDNPMHKDLCIPKILSGPAQAQRCGSFAG